MIQDHQHPFKRLLIITPLRLQARQAKKRVQRHESPPVSVAMRRDSRQMRSASALRPSTSRG
jgi:hypothetical protein